MSEATSSPSLPTSPCKGCGKPIVWGRTFKGTKIPLDASVPCYLRVSTIMKDGLVQVERWPAGMISHFITCPNADEFSKSKQKGKTDAHARGASGAL